MMPPLSCLRPLRALAVLLAIALVWPMVQARPAEPVVLASFPSGTFLENGEIDADGTLFFTSYLDRRIYTLKPGGTPTVWAELQVHPVALLLGPDAVIVSAHGQPFTAGPGFTRTQQIVTLGRDGSPRRSVPVPEARFLNGMTRAAGGVLIADSIAGAAVPPVTSTLNVSSAKEVGSTTLVARTVIAAVPENAPGVSTRLVPSIVASTMLAALLCTV